MAKSSEKIIKVLKNNWSTIQRFGVKRLGLFGSAARGGQTKNSDLDFLVDFKVKSFDQYMDLKFFLEDLFQCQVDLVLADQLKPRLRPNILKEVIYA